MNSEIENTRNKIMNSMKLLNSILDIDEEKSSGPGNVSWKISLTKYRGTRIEKQEDGQDKDDTVNTIYTYDSDLCAGKYPASSL